MSPLACTYCGHTGPQVAVVFDPGREGIPMCSTADPDAANLCAERERANKITEEKADA